MRKLIFIIALLVGFLGFSQGGPKVDAIKFRGKVTTAVRDLIDVPTGETWLIHNVTTNQFEWANDDDVWNTLSVSGEPSNGDKGDVVVTLNGLDWRLDANSVGSSEIDNGSIIAQDIQSATIDLSLLASTNSPSSGDVLQWSGTGNTFTWVANTGGSADNLGNHSITQDLLPDTNNTWNLGSSSNKVAVAHIATLVLGGETGGVSNINLATDAGNVILAWDGSKIRYGGEELNQDAVEVPYDNATSGLAATNVKTAIDEVKAESIESDVSQVAGSSTVDNIVQKAYSRSEGTPPAGTTLLQTDVPIIETLTGASIDLAEVPAYVDDRLVDTDAFTFTDADAWEEAIIDLEQSGVPTFSGTGLTFTQLDGTTAWEDNVRIQAKFKVQANGTDVFYYFIKI